MKQIKMNQGCRESKKPVSKNLRIKEVIDKKRESEKLSKLKKNIFNSFSGIYCIWYFQ